MVTDKEKLKLRKRLRDAFRHNNFKRPTHCNYCGKETKIEAHHYRYVPEDYVWVCKKCHAILHKGFRQTSDGRLIDTWKRKH